MEQMNPITIPFANSGDKENIVGTSTSTGTVNWEKGFPSDFSKSIADNGKFVKRKHINEIFYYLSAAIQYLQKGGLAIFNTAFTQNSGTYKKDSALWYKNNSKGTWQLVVATTDTNVAPSDSNVASGTPWKPYCLLPYTGSKLTLQESLETKDLKISGRLDFNGTKATGCPNPTENNDFVNKRYVDSAAGKIWPNYALAQDISSGYTTIKNGWIFVQRSFNAHQSLLYIDGVVVWDSGVYDAVHGGTVVPVAKGSVVTTSGGIASLKFIPVKE